MQGLIKVAVVAGSLSHAVDISKAIDVSSEGDGTCEAVPCAASYEDETNLIQTGLQLKGKSLIQTGLQQKGKSLETYSSVRRTHIAVAVDVGPSYEHTLEYLVLLHGSWQHVVSEDDGSPENALIDMLVTCERCSRLPIECLPMLTDDGSLRPYRSQHRCMFAENHDRDKQYFKKMGHPAMLSVSFLVTEPMKSMLPRYDYVLRTDQDAVISPRILTWRPPYGMVFGSAGVENEWTMARLEAIAKEKGWRHQKVHQICSGWYVPPELALQLASLTVTASKHLLENEFGYREDQGYMAKKVKLGGMDWWKESNHDGEWPKWWRGVTSLYASNLAINHLVDNLNESFVTKDIDYATLEHAPVMQHVHMHAIQGEGGFNKFRFRDELLQLDQASTSHMTFRKMIGHFEAMTDELIQDWEQGRYNHTEIYSDASKYTMWLAARGVSRAAEVFLDEPEDLDLASISRAHPKDPLWYRIVSRRDGQNVASLIYEQEPVLYEASAGQKNYAARYSARASPGRFEQWSH